MKEKLLKEWGEIKHWTVKGFHRTNWVKLGFWVALLILPAVIFGAAPMIDKILLGSMVAAIYFLIAPVLVGCDVMIEEWQRNNKEN